VSRRIAGNSHAIAMNAPLFCDEASHPGGEVRVGNARAGTGPEADAKKRLDEQFLRTQRLESIGMLASGIAHDLNNVLAPIILAAPVLREHATNPEDIRIITSLEKSA
jgi:hypothetical protein